MARFIWFRLDQNIVPNEEIFFNYGAEYWASRFHRFALVGTTELSPLQKDLVKVYHLVPLPDGTARTKLDVKSGKAPEVDHMGRLQS